MSVIPVLTAGFGEGHNAAARSIIEALGRGVRAVVIVDEAYHEFMPDDQPRATTLLAGRPRLLISRTMSKAFGVMGGYIAADKVIIDREVNRHAAFGLGIHRCLGSNLARLELRVAVEEFLAAYPDFELAPGEIVKWSVGQIRGPRELPVRITARTN